MTLRAWLRRLALRVYRRLGGTGQAAFMEEARVSHVVGADGGFALFLNPASFTFEDGTTVQANVRGKDTPWLHCTLTIRPMPYPPPQLHPAATYTPDMEVSDVTVHRPPKPYKRAP